MHSMNAFWMVCMICLPYWPVHPRKPHEKPSCFMSTYMRTCQSHITNSILRCGCSVDKFKIIKLIELSGLFFLYLPPQLVLMVAAFISVRPQGFSAAHLNGCSCTFKISSWSHFSVVTSKVPHSGGVDGAGCCHCQYSIIFFRSAVSKENECDSVIMLRHAL